LKNIFVTFFFLVVSGALFAQQNEISNLEIRGLKKTKRSFITNIIESKSKGILDSVKLENDMVRLKRLPLVAHASYQVFYSHENKYNVFYNIEENFTLIPNANIWTATNQQFAYKVGVNEFNFLGRGIGLGGYYQNNGYDSYSINFRAPYLFNRYVGLAINRQDWKSVEPLFFENGSADYLYNNRSLEFLSLFEFSRKHKLQLGVNFFTEEYEFLEGNLAEGIPTRLEEDKILFKLVYDYDVLDYDYQYVSGFRSQLYLQAVRSDNQFQSDFLIAWNDFYYYLRVGDKGNWANRLRLGLSSNNDSPFAPFSVDNNLNVRGVGNLIDRGTGVIVLNTEYRHTLIDKEWFALQSNAFVDAGSWRNPGGDFNDFTQSQNLRIYPGVGLRFISKKIYNAIFRIDYGYGITQNATSGFVFGIGQYF